MLSASEKRVKARFKQAKVEWFGEKKSLCRVMAGDQVLMVAVPYPKEKPADTERRCWDQADARYAKEVWG